MQIIYNKYNNIYYKINGDCCSTIRFIKFIFNQ